MTDYEALSKIDFLPELETPDLHTKAHAIQELVERSFSHPSGLFYSILLIDGPHHLQPMGRADMEGISDTVAEGHYDDGGASAEAARDEGMTFENSITSAGNYLQSQAARFAVTAEPATYAEDEPDRSGPRRRQRDERMDSSRNVPDCRGCGGSCGGSG